VTTVYVNGSVDIYSGHFKYIFFVYILPENGHRSGPKHVVVVHNKIEHKKYLLRTVGLIKILVDTRATGCITQKLSFNLDTECGTSAADWNSRCKKIMNRSYYTYNDCVYFTWGWPVEAETCSDVNRRIWNKKLLRMTTAHPKQVIVTDATGCNPQKIKKLITCN
jgi:hypothetical protein